MPKHAEGLHSSCHAVVGSLHHLGVRFVCFPTWARLDISQAVRCDFTFDLVTQGKRTSCCPFRRGQKARPYRHQRRFSRCCFGR